MAGSRTDSGCTDAGSLPPGRTRFGPRKSFQVLMIANTVTTPITGFDIGSTIDQKRRNGPAPSVCAASKTSRGRLSKKRITSTTLNALAPDGNHTAQKVLSRDPPNPRGCRIVRYSGISRTIDGRNSVAITRPVMILPYLGRRMLRANPPVVETTI